MGREELIAECLAAGHTLVSGNRMRCGWHDDRTPSAGVFQSKETGDWLFHCHVCSVTLDAEGVRARRLGVPRKSMRVQEDAPQPQAPKLYASPGSIAEVLGDVEETYRYTNPDTGVPDLVVFRRTGKRFVQAVPLIGGWAMKGPSGRTPLYNRVGIACAKRVLLVEGEKAAKAAIGAGIQATTWPGGCKGVGKADFSPLAGKDVIVWPDHDPERDGVRAGHEAMRQAIAAMNQLDPRPNIFWIDPSDLGLESDGSDVVDYLDDCSLSDPSARREALELALTAVQPVDPIADLVQFQEDTIAGKNRPVPFPLTYVHRLSRALVPETLTLLCGEPGAGKSILLLQGMIRWVEQGIPCAVWMLEDQRHRHLSRALAVASGCGDLTREEWVETHPDEARALRERHRALLERLSSSIRATDDGQVTYDAVLEWAAEQSAAGRQVLAIDPITACESKGDPWIEDRRFLMGLKRILRKHGNRAVLVTHPKLGAESKSGGELLARLSGGAAFPRFAHTVLWLSAERAGERVFTVKSDGGQFDYSDINRLIHVAKCRNGPGSGAKVAARFEHTDGRFMFEEKGVVLGIRRNDSA